MTRESCIAHAPKQPLAIVRQDYYELTSRDACAAALLNIFEYWANAALATDPTVERPWVGERPIREFEQMLLGIATDKQIRKRLAMLEDRGFIRTRQPAKRGAAKAYQVMVPELQQALSAQMADAEKSLGSNNQPPFGQMTDEKATLRSNDQQQVGRMTDIPSVKQPLVRRSNDRALKKLSPEFKEEGSQETIFALSDSTVSARATTVSSSVQIGSVTYAQAPETIDLAELWAANPGMAKQQIRLLAPGHKRPEMVAHGVGHWWLGPGLNDFDEPLIQACQERKRKFQQAHNIGDVKTYINNMLRNGDWANFALRCDEAKVICERVTELTVARAVEPSIAGRSPFERSPAERRDSALGLARYKVSQGLIEQAMAIARQFDLTRAELGLADGGIVAFCWPQAA
jgi:hypothetical protein